MGKLTGIAIFFFFLKIRRFLAPKREKIFGSKAREDFFQKKVSFLFLESSFLIPLLQFSSLGWESCQMEFLTNKQNTPSSSSSAMQLFLP